MLKKFQRNIENFVCENCVTTVSGNGYTNHCPQCLFSKHVDINPGDRLNSCKGLMRPISITLKQGEYIIVHQCVVCGFVKNNKTSEQDSFEKILEIVRSS